MFGPWNWTTAQSSPNCGMLFGSRAILGMIGFTERRGKCSLSSCKEQSIHFTFSAFVRRTMGESSGRRLQWQSTLKPSDQSHRQHSYAAWVMIILWLQIGQGENTKGKEFSSWRCPLSCFCQVYSPLFVLTGLQYSYWSLHSLNFVVQPELTKLAYFTVWTVSTGLALPSVIAKSPWA